MEIVGEWVVQLLKDGQVLVKGPILNKVMSLGALAEAANAIERWHLAKAAGPRVQAHTEAEVPPVRRNGQGGG